jgi:hypothetical protein
MVDFNAIGEAKNYIERPGDTLLRTQGKKIIKAAGIFDGKSSKKASLALAAAEGIYSALKESKIRYNQDLESSKRGALTVRYDSYDAYSSKVVIPFYENPKITEENTATYSTRNIFGRNSPQRNFIHAGPRVFNVEITYTLDHFMSFDYKRIFQFLDLNRFEHSVIDDIEHYLNYIIPIINEKAVRLNEGVFENLHKKAEQFIDKYARIDLSPQGVQDKYDELFGPGPSNPLYDILVAYYSVLAVIRSTTLTSESKPYVKPPIVELKFGSGWDNIKCIVTSYSIQHSQEDGYDVHTLLPRKIKYSLRLEEYMPVGEEVNPKSSFDNVFNSSKSVAIDASIRDIRDSIRTSQDLLRNF